MKSKSLFSMIGSETPGIISFLQNYYFFLQGSAGNAAFQMGRADSGYRIDTVAVYNQNFGIIKKKYNDSSQDV